ALLSCLSPTRRPPTSPLFPYTTLFRSQRQAIALSRSALTVLRRSGAADADDFAILGEPARVRDEVLRLREKLGMTHLIARTQVRSEEHTSELQSLTNLVCRLLLEKKKQ